MNEAFVGTEWTRVWKRRGKAYHEANARYPAARAEEREYLITGLRLEKGMTLLDVAAGGGYLVEGVRSVWKDSVRFLAIEPSETFAANLPSWAERVPESSIVSFNLPGSSVDRVSNLSGLHHTPEVARFFAEAHRVLRAGGVCGAADVREGSSVAEWLDRFVDRYNSEGHRGVFFAGGALKRRMLDAGFRKADEHLRAYGWNFSSEKEMVEFCGLLFGLDRARPAEILDGIRRFLGFSSLPGGRVRMNWELLYVFGVK